jgi:tripartite-type tricarboxylate transporter receptor subunit TctC
MSALSLFTKIVSLVAFAFTAVVAAAQPYPSRVVRMVVAYPPGGSIDVVARLVNQRLTTAFGQQFIIDNRAGAAGRTRAVNRVPACGM